MIAVCLSVAACAPATSSVSFVEAPVLDANPSGRVPLAAAIRLTPGEAVSVAITISDGANEWGHDFGGFDAGEAVVIPVVGMRADRDHDVGLTVTGDDGAGYEQTFSYRTPPLPENPLENPVIDVKVSSPELMEPGYTFLSMRRRALGRAHWMTGRQREFSTDWGKLVALNAAGEVVWYYESEFRTSGIDRLQNGNILLHRTDSSTLEIDLLGNTVRQFYAEGRPFPPPENPDAVAIKGMDTLHHQPHEMPNGDFLAFAANPYRVENWPTSETDPDAPRADAMIMADTVVQISPEGDIVWSWDTFDALDPYRIGYDTFWSYWWVRGFPGHMDWTHANGLSYDESDDSVLVSLRNQSAIVKVDRQSGAIKWILGRHEDWPDRLKSKLLEPVGDLLWPGYQHNPRMTHAGTVILFDNRAHGATMPFEPRLPLQQAFSRGVEFRVDEENMAVEQIWTSGDSQGEDPCFANAMSDAWRLPETDNRLVIFAFCLPLLDGVSQDSMDETSRVVSDLPYGGRVVEYSGDDVVFRADFRDEFDLMQWEVYGGFRTPTLYGATGTSH